MASQQENNLYTCDQVRTLDQLAIEQGNVSGLELMQRAGQAIFDHIIKHYPNTAITVFCGPGNNGGDGYIVATLAKQQHIPINLIYIKSPEQLSGDAKLAYTFADKADVSMRRFTQDLEVNHGVVVDALLGIGIKGSLKKPYAQAIELINKSALPVIAVDLPSGLNGDTGAVESCCINAQTTISFIGLKQGLFTNNGRNYCGNIVLQDLQVKSSIFNSIKPSSTKLQLSALLKHLKPRKPNSHKNNYGHVLVIGGDYGYAGATLLAAEAALRTGAGLVTAATRKEHIGAIVSRCPEIMAHGIESAEMLRILLNKANVIIIGPGLGQSEWARELLNETLKAKMPTVIDADALNLISCDNTLPNPRDNQYIFTPHPKEAARLLNKNTDAIQNNRFAAIKEIAKKYQAQVLLKGSGSLVCESENSTVGICVAGNPGMATGGMGDILTGVIGGLLAQGVDKAKCLALATCLHAEAGDMAAKDGQKSLLPSDLIKPLRKLIS